MCFLVLSIGSNTWPKLTHCHDLEYLIEKYGNDKTKVKPDNPGWVDNLYCAYLSSSTRRSSFQLNVHQLPILQKAPFNPC